MVEEIIERICGRYEYEEMPAGWTTNGEVEGQENNVTRCNPATEAETVAMIGAADLSSPAAVLYRDPVTYRVARPAVRNGSAVEVLEVAGIEMGAPALQAHWRAYLYYPTAEAATSVACPEFAGLFNYVPHAGMAIFEGRNRHTVTAFLVHKEGRFWSTSSQLLWRCYSLPAAPQVLLRPRSSHVRFIQTPMKSCNALALPDAKVGAVNAR